ncbi:hypothetical protein BZG02_17205 [Labilibaculum filiforme]|uniref:HTH luxR-type domain-containing protein n=1 Tax=Labilibaculum filiforme TaxID=1940526 RepID=A0A2N3HSL4_9BACT|nr:hypothetical protein [Labilibaculum filiforme]PKQ61033.1 hypothetical protein BZG02_17205 [Labilibaculum filiforme]
MIQIARCLRAKFTYCIFIVGILTINNGTNSPLQAQQFNHYLPESFHPLKTDSKSVIDLVTKKYKQVVQKQDTVSVIQTLILLSSMERINLNYRTAFDRAGEALFLAEQYNNALLIAKAHEELGVLNYLFKQDDSAGLHFRNSLLFYKKSQAINKQQSLLHPYYNLLLYYQRIKDYQKTKAYIDSCSFITKSNGLLNFEKIFINEKRANLCRWDSDFDKAIAFIEKSIQTLENLKTDEKLFLKQKSFLIILYATKGSIYRSQGKIEKAKIFLEKSLQEKDLYGEHTFYKSFVYKSYATLLYDIGEFKKSYENLLRAQEINDKYLNPRNDENHNFLSIKNRYSEEINKKNTEINLKNLELAESKRENLRFRIFFFIAISLIIVVVFIFRYRTQYLKHQKENAINNKKQQQSKELIELKNKELTSTMLQLIEKDEIIKTLSNQLKKDPSNKILLSSIEKHSVSLWEAFNTRFIALNKEFYDRLKKQVPDLSAADLKICALIKLNFSGKEMAYLLGISEGSVNVARHRLRKKMGIDRETNLVQYINSI